MSPLRTGALRRVFAPWLVTVGILSGAVSSGAAGPKVTYSATGYHASLAYAGDRWVLPDGEHLRHQIQFLRVDSGNPHLVGRRTLVANGVKTADGVTTLHGTWIGEAGAWTGSVFTPSTGIWDGTWSGDRMADGALSLTFSARGVGGAIDGLELKETAVRASGPEVDPDLRLTITGATAPTGQWFSTIFSEDFEDGLSSPDWKHEIGWGTENWHARPRLLEHDGVLTFRLEPLSAQKVEWMYIPLAVSQTISLRDGQTAEIRMDVVDFGAYRDLLLNFGLIHDFRNGEPKAAMLSLSGWITNDQRVGLVYMEKRHAYDPEIGYMEGIEGDYIRGGLTLIFSLSRVQNTNLVQRGIILDRAQGGAVIYDHSWTDTPAADPVDSGHDNTGIRTVIHEAGFFLGTWPDFPIVPPSDLSITIDNFSVRLYDGSPYDLQVERAVLLTPPMSVSSCVVEGAPTVQGPWTLLSAPEVEVHGARHLVVPVSEASNLGVYRIK
ncbi:MAG: hypothetical protein JNK85_14470 [Verrucomicrobiales bacterium]|nr:hypothetical protein [Verrucomicrobiales bacterium]